MIEGTDEKTPMPSFSHAEMTRLRNRMREARRVAPAEITKKWEKLEEVGLRSGKTLAKRTFLFAWLRDPTWQTMLVQEDSHHVQSHEQGNVGRWITKGRLEVLVGCREARAMLDANELEVCTNPARPDSLLYKYVEAYDKNLDQRRHEGSQQNSQPPKPASQPPTASQPASQPSRQLDSHRPISQPTSPPASQPANHPPSQPKTQPANMRGMRPTPVPRRRWKPASTSPRRRACSTWRTRVRLLRGNRPKTP